ncbi:hypothetical protein [Aedoeadaptatus coxii]|uniref:hypothetical protein n=1 Tax=Aedoeadaptatus coxii TaxID=755172 RepID=UPI002AD4C8AF|nr:hypothetical protein [Peptoniphilus coxii]
MDLDMAFSAFKFIVYAVMNVFVIKWTYYLYKNAKSENEVLENIKYQQKERIRRIKQFRDDFYDEG